MEKDKPLGEMSGEELDGWLYKATVKYAEIREVLGVKLPEPVLINGTDMLTPLTRDGRLVGIVIHSPPREDREIVVIGDISHD